MSGKNIYLRRKNEATGNRERPGTGGRQDADSKVAGACGTAPVTQGTGTQALLKKQRLSDLKENTQATAGQDGSAGKHRPLPRTATSKSQLNYRTTVTQSHQKSS